MYGYENCVLCPNLCGVNRAEGGGLCDAGTEMTVSRIAPHFFEEPPISGEKGSGTVFFSGCTMRCVYCQNHEISRKTNGKRYSPQELSTALRGLEALGVHNINFVTPTHYARRIADTLDIYRPALPVIFNTSGYERAETVQYLQKYADVWLPDFKYGDDNLALLLSGRKCYTVAARTSVAEMLKKPQKYKDGLIQSGVILRHLVLPGFLENSKSVLDIIKEDFGTDVTLSIMAQYTPVCITDKPSLHRALKPLEYKIILNYALALGFRDIFTQEILSSDERYIPDFDNT